MPSGRASRPLAVLVTAFAVSWLGCGGGADLAAPEVGTVEIVTITSGPEPDGDGYTISIDGASPASVATNATFRQAGLTAGNHTVELSGLAANCAVSGALRLGVSVTANAVTTATFAIICAPTTGTIQVTTTSGTPADPDGYQLLLDGAPTQAIATAATATIPGVAPGAHTVGLDGVAPDCQVDGENPRSVIVEAGGTVQVNWNVACTATTGSLSITISGLPAGTDAAVTVTGPNGFTQQVTATATLTGLAPGNYALTAAELTSGGTKYTASPASRTITVAAAGTASATVTYSGSSSSLNLRIEGWQITQSVQSPAGDVPLVANRDGYVRVFVLANAANTAAPSVRLRLYSNGALASTLTIPAPGTSTPTQKDEGRLSSSWNVKIPSELFGPRLSVLADVDPGNAIPESNEADNTFPVSGTPQAQDVRSASTLAITFVPVRQKANGMQGDVSTANKARYLETVRRMYPLPGTDGDAHAVYTTATDGALEGDDGNGAWSAILGEIDALRLTEGTGRTYYGVVRIDYSSGIAGLGYVGGRTAMGYDRDPDRMRVVAHELGHTWGRQHSPCGGPPGPDPAYPYPGGVIGVYGIEMATEVLKPPSTSDIMGYCNSPWISDYTYRAVQAFRAASGSIAPAPAGMQRCLLVWGRIENGRAMLEPAFEVVTRPSMPEKPGPYSVDGLSAGGGRIFSLSFDAAQVADDPRGSRHFAFAMPLGEAAAAAIGTLRLAGPGAAVAMARTQAPPAAAQTGDIVQARTVAGGANLRWDTVAHPMLMVRDPDTGEVLSFARGGDVDVTTDKRELDVIVSDRVGSRPVRVSVESR